MLQKMRSNELTIYSAAVIFFLAWFQAMIGATTLIGYSRNLLSAFFPLFTISRYTLLLLILLIPLGGLPILLAAGWKGLKARKYHVLLFLCLGFISPPITIFLAVFFINAIGITWILSLCLVSPGLGLALICFAVQGVTPSRRVTHSALYLAAPLPLIMLVGCVSLLFCVLSVSTTSGIASYMMNEGFFFWFSVLCLMLLLMGAACSFSLFSLLKGFQAKKATQETL